MLICMRLFPVLMPDATGGDGDGRIDRTMFSYDNTFNHPQLSSMSSLAPPWLRPRGF